jgi:hypothetical protein
MGLLLVSVDWGSVPAWVGSVLTGVSLLIAATAYRRSVNEKTREQAGEVSAWFDSTADNGSAICIRNGSGAAIYEVVALVRSTGEEIDLKAVPPETTVTHVVMNSSGSRGPVPVRFRDSIGRYWRRDDEGRLTGFGGPDLSLEDAKRFKLFR